MARKQITYEWAVEETGQYGDITNVDHAPSLTAALEMAESRAAGRVEIALVRHVGNQLDSETARHYAYLRADGALPEHFDDGGPAIPARFHAEAKAARFPVTLRLAA